MQQNQRLCVVLHPIFSIVFIMAITPQDELYMARCIELATRSHGYHQPNPEVGALLVHNGRIIGEGFHQIYGSAHAEVNAVQSVQEADRALISQSTLYVTLEPCFHVGKTPPCVDLVLRERIPRVVIGCRDPFPLVAGQSIAKLQAAGVDVEVGALQSQVEWLNRRFLTMVQQHRPYVVLKYAVSNDGFLSKIGERVAISNALSQRLVHQWRSEEQAILVGTNTALIDNPHLTNRLYKHRTPIRIVLDKSLRLPNTLNVFDGSVPTYVITENRHSPRLDYLTYGEIDFDAQLIPNLLTYLYKQKIQSVLVEGGAQVLQSFVNSGLWDEARVLVGNVNLGDGVPAPRLPMVRTAESWNVGDTSVQIFHNK